MKAQIQGKLADCSGDNPVNKEKLIGKYQHYRNKQFYEVIGFAIHSETLEEMVVYKALYESEDFGKDKMWVRPKNMFFEEVEHEGKWVPRFTSIKED